MVVSPTERKEKGAGGDGGRGRRSSTGGAAALLIHIGIEQKQRSGHGSGACGRPDMSGWWRDIVRWGVFWYFWAVRSRSEGPDFGLVGDFGRGRVGGLEGRFRRGWLKNRQGGTLDSERGSLHGRSLYREGAMFGWISSVR